jgi:hypothetical protein
MTRLKLLAPEETKTRKPETKTRKPYKQEIQINNIFYAAKLFRN